MSTPPPPVSPRDDAEVETPLKKRAWAKPVIRPLYQIESVSTNPVYDGDKVGEPGYLYRGRAGS